MRPARRRDVRSAVAQKRGLTSIDGANALIVILVIVQMWLLTAALEAYLAGHGSAALPAAIASGVLCVVAFLLYRFVRRVDRSVRSPGPSGPSGSPPERP